MYLQSTSLTHGHSSLYLYPGTWVQSSVSLQIGLKWFVNLWDTYWVLGPGSWVWCQGSTLFLCNLIFGPHIPGPVNLWDTYWVLGPGSWVSDPGPETQDPACGLAPQSLEFSGKKLFAHIEIWICILMRIAHTQCSFGNVQTKLELNNKHVWISKAEIIYKQSLLTNFLFTYLPNKIIDDFNLRKV